MLSSSDNISKLIASQFKGNLHMWVAVNIYFACGVFPHPACVRFKTFILEPSYYSCSNQILKSQNPLIRKNHARESTERKSILITYRKWAIKEIKSVKQKNCWISLNKRPVMDVKQRIKNVSDVPIQRSSGAPINYSYKRWWRNPMQEMHGLGRNMYLFSTGWRNGAWY